MKKQDFKRDFLVLTKEEVENSGELKARMVTINKMLNEINDSLDETNTPDVQGLLKYDMEVLKPMRWFEPAESDGHNYQDGKCTECCAPETCPGDNKFCD